MPFNDLPSETLWLSNEPLLEVSNELLPEAPLCNELLPLLELLNNEFLPLFVKLSLWNEVEVALLERESNELSNEAIVCWRVDVMDL